MVKWYGSHVKTHYKNWEIGELLPEDNIIVSCFVFDETEQGYYFWYNLAKRCTPYTIEHYNALAEIFGDPPYDENINIEDFM